LLWAIIAVVWGAVAVVGAYYFDLATESKAFCGQLCHPNRPQLAAQNVSAHTDVECGICHVGPGIMPKVVAKIMGTGELYMQLTNSYERPITHPVARLKSADVICEQCHSPHVPYEEQIERISRFADDEENSETQITLAMRIGGGEDPSVGAHWHIDNPVWFVSREVDAQNIPWVGTTGEDGQMVEYVAQDNHLSDEELASLPRQEMDCMTCHNRSGHDFHKPEDRVDQAIAAGQIDKELPYVKREAMRLLSASYPTEDDGLKAMEGLAEFYRTEYADVYSAQQQQVQQAVETLQEIYGYTTFPTMNLTWDVYPDNLGHQDFPGCFRCHDGKHQTDQGQAISADCTLCHSVPAIVDAGRRLDPVLAASVLVPAEQEPDSHKDPDFLLDHRILANESCADCHGPIQFGTDNSSFCANEACHSQGGFRLDLDPDFVHPVQLEGKHAQATCNECHQGVREPSMADCATCHTPVPEPHFGATCSECHTTESWAASAVSWIIEAPSNPHGTADLNCQTCHGTSGASPAPVTHDAFPSDSCLYCHDVESRIAVPVIPHPVEEPGNCLACHGEGVLKPTSAIHQDVAADSCTDCHESKPLTNVPVIPHIVEDRGRCLTCHDEGKLKPRPPNHAGWPDLSCLLCHETSVAE
jgi:hypothetical protein